MARPASDLNKSATEEVFEQSNPKKSAATFAVELRGYVEQEHNKLNQKLDSLSNVGLIELARDVVLKLGEKSDFTKSPELNGIYMEWIRYIESSANGVLTNQTIETKKFFERIEKCLTEKYPNQKESILKLFNQNNNFVSAFVNICYDKDFKFLVTDLFEILVNIDFLGEEKVKEFLQKAPNDQIFFGCVPGLQERLINCGDEIFDSIESKIKSCYNQTKEELIIKHNLKECVSVGSQIHLMSYVDYLIGTLTAEEAEKKDIFYQSDQYRSSYDIDYKITQEFPKLFRQKLKEIAENDKRFYCFKKESEADQRTNGFIAQLKNLAIDDIQRFEDEDYTLEGSLDEVFSPVFGKGKNQEYLIENNDGTYALKQEAIKQKITKKTKEFNRVLGGKNQEYFEELEAEGLISQESTETEVGSLAMKNRESFEELTVEDLTSERSMAKIAEYLHSGNEDKQLMALDALSSGVRAVLIKNGDQSYLRFRINNTIAYLNKIINSDDFLSREYGNNRLLKSKSEFLSQVGAHILSINLLNKYKEVYRGTQRHSIPLRTALIIGASDEEISEIIKAKILANILANINGQRGGLDPRCLVLSLINGDPSLRSLSIFPDLSFLVGLDDISEIASIATKYDLIDCLSSNPRTIKVFQQLKNRIDEQGGNQGQKIKVPDHYLIANFATRALKRGNIELLEYAIDNFAIFEDCCEDYHDSPPESMYAQTETQRCFHDLISLAIDKCDTELFSKILKSTMIDCEGKLKCHLRQMAFLPYDFSGPYDGGNVKKKSIIEIIIERGNVDFLREICSVFKLRAEDLLSFVNNKLNIVHLAALYNKPEIIKFFKEEINFEPSQLMTVGQGSIKPNPAMIAAKNINAEVLQALIDCGVDKNVLKKNNANKHNLLRFLSESDKNSSKKDQGKIKKYKKFLEVLIDNGIFTKDEIFSSREFCPDNLTFHENAIKEKNINIIYALIELGFEKDKIFLPKQDDKSLLIPINDDVFLESCLEIGFSEDFKKRNSQEFVNMISFVAEAGESNQNKNILGLIIKFLGKESFLQGINKIIAGLKNNYDNNTSVRKTFFGSADDGSEFKYAQKILDIFVKNGLTLEEIFGSVLEERDSEDWTVIQVGLFLDLILGQEIDFGEFYLLENEAFKYKILNLSSIEEKFKNLIKFVENPTEFLSEKQESERNNLIDGFLKQINNFHKIKYLDLMLQKSLDNSSAENKEEIREEISKAKQKIGDFISAVCDYSTPRSDIGAPNEVLSYARSKFHLVKEYFLDNQEDLIKTSVENNSEDNYFDLVVSLIGSSYVEPEEISFIKDKKTFARFLNYLYKKINDPDASMWLRQDYYNASRAFKKSPATNLDKQFEVFKEEECMVLRDSKIVAGFLESLRKEDMKSLSVENIEFLMNKIFELGDAQTLNCEHGNDVKYNLKTALVLLLDSNKSDFAIEYFNKKISQISDLTDNEVVRLSSLIADLKRSNYIKDDDFCNRDKMVERMLSYDSRRRSGMLQDDGYRFIHEEKINQITSNFPVLLPKQFAAVLSEVKFAAIILIKENDQYLNPQYIKEVSENLDEEGRRKLLEVLSDKLISEKISQDCLKEMFLIFINLKLDGFQYSVDSSDDNELFFYSEPNNYSFIIKNMFELVKTREDLNIFYDLVINMRDEYVADLSPNKSLAILDLLTANKSSKYFENYNQEKPKSILRNAFNSDNVKTLDQIIFEAICNIQKSTKNNDEIGKFLDQKLEENKTVYDFIEEKNLNSSLQLISYFKEHGNIDRYGGFVASSDDAQPSPRVESPVSVDSRSRSSSRSSCSEILH